MLGNYLHSEEWRPGGGSSGNTLVIMKSQRGCGSQSSRPEDMTEVLLCCFTSVVFLNPFPCYQLGRFTPHKSGSGTTVGLCDITQAWYPKLLFV